MRRCVGKHLGTRKVKAEEYDEKNFLCLVKDTKSSVLVYCQLLMIKITIIDKVTIC